MKKFNFHNSLLSSPALSCCSSHSVFLWGSYSYTNTGSISPLGSTGSSFYSACFHSSPVRSSLDLTQHPASVSNESDVVNPESKTMYKSNSTAHSNIVNI